MKKGWSQALLGGANGEAKSQQAQTQMFNPNETCKKIYIVQTLEQVAWGGCEISIIGGIQKPSACVCGHHAVADPALNRRIGLNDSKWSL